MARLAELFDQIYLLGVPEMDATHREFVALVDRIANAETGTFSIQFAELLQHTETHFASENAMMAASGFPALKEHQDEHQRVLGDLQRLYSRVRKGNIAMARAYVSQQIPEWFDLHAKTMDSALAAHLKSRQM